jgi:hypothetical protein
MSIKNADVSTFKNADVSSITKSVNGKLSKEDVKRLMNSWRDRDAELVTGIFKNNEEPGQSTSFRFKAYPGDDFKEWFFEDGEKYQIPRGIARQLATPKNISIFHQKQERLVLEQQLKMVLQRVMNNS